MEGSSAAAELAARTNPSTWLSVSGSRRMCVADRIRLAGSMGSVCNGWLPCRNQAARYLCPKRSCYMVSGLWRVAGAWVGELGWRELGWRELGWRELGTTSPGVARHRGTEVPAIRR